MSCGMAALRIPRLAAPVLGVGGRRIVMSFPPDCAVRTKSDVSENRVPVKHRKRIRIRMRTGPRSDAEKSRLGIDRPEPSIRTYAQPGNIIADSVDLPALHACGRHQHREVGFSAGAGKCAADVVDLTIWAFDADDQHMLGEPAFLFAELARDSKSEALLRQQRVAPVSRADAPDRVVLGIMADESAVHIQIRLGVKATGEVV